MQWQWYCCCSCFCCHCRGFAFVFALILLTCSIWYMYVTLDSWWLLYCFESTTLERNPELIFMGCWSRWDRLLLRSFEFFFQVRKWALRFVLIVIRLKVDAVWNLDWRQASYAIINWKVHWIWFSKDRDHNLQWSPLYAIFHRIVIRI